MFDKVRDERRHVVEDERVGVEPNDDGEVRVGARDKLHQIELELRCVPLERHRLSDATHDATHVLWRQRRENAVARLAIVRQQAARNRRRVKQKRAHRNRRHCRELFAAVGKEAHDRRAQLLQHCASSQARAWAKKSERHNRHVTCEFRRTNAVDAERAHARMHTHIHAARRTHTPESVMPKLVRFCFSSS